MDVNVSIGLAFLGGLGSFFSPCVLPLIPAYVSYLGGMAASEGERRPGERLVTFTHGLIFILGFSLVFVLLGVTASALGNLLSSLRDWVARGGGIIIIILGLHMTGIFRIPFLDHDMRVHSAPHSRWRYISSFLMGVFFSAGWSPCIGPVLGTILTLAVSHSSPPLGAKLLFSYSAGLAVPFLLAALGLDSLSRMLHRRGKAMHYVEIGMGSVLVLLGLTLFFNLFQSFSAYAQFFWGNTLHRWS